MSGAVYEGAQTSFANKYTRISFESCAVYKGAQTLDKKSSVHTMFEGCAVYEDSQSGSRKCSPAGPFESCAVYEGTQTHPAVEKLYSYLRAVLFTRGLKPDTSGRIRIGV